MQSTTATVDTATAATSGGPASQWDRLPHALQDKVLAAAGPFTGFVCGRLRPIELCGLPQPVAVQFWLDLLAADWQGDLARLSRVFVGVRELLPRVRSRDMLRRMLAAGLVRDDQAWDVALHHGWDDMLAPAGDPQELANRAARAGARHVLEALVERRGLLDWNVEMAEWAADGGQLALVQWLHARMGPRPWSPRVMDWAANSGNLDLVRWLHAHRAEGCTHIAMDYAAECGHAHVVRWLDEHRAEGGVHAVGYAESGGHLDVLEHLLESHPEYFDHPQTGFLCIGPLRVMRWAHARGLIKDPMRMVYALIHDGDAEGVAWACSTFGIPVTQHMVNLAATGNSLPLFRWMLAQPGMTIAKPTVKAAARSSKAIGILAWILERDRKWVAIAEQTAAESQLDDLADWLRERFPQQPPPSPREPR
ncbi:hypothetical protein HK105_207349 [Polyrhizophydium stewartii]|uniref:Ankyrin repeat domain-containing protein n=1 Tax=Polyrhizophydium stewartii TaxID=2732419 RepID=A0ABR4N0W5_9FUNG